MSWPAPATSRLNWARAGPDRHTTLEEPPLFLVDVPMEDIFWGVAPFVLGEFVVILLLVLFPALALWLPSLMP